MDPKITRRAVAELTAKAFDANLKELCSCSRNREHTKARFAVWYLIKEFRPETSLKELGNMLDKDHTTVINGLVRAKEFLDLNRDFADRLHRARRMIAQWRPNVPPEARNVSTLRHLAAKSETPPASEIEAPEPSFHGGDGEYDIWFRNSCKRSEERFLRIAGAMHPERVVQKDRAA